MHSLLRSFAVILVIVAAGCEGRAPTAAPAPASLARAAASQPRYDQVFRKATHNAYWLDVANPSIDLSASGTEERIVDQLLYEHVRALEFDLHPELLHAGEFLVYHTANGDVNSSCRTLADCMQPILRLGYLVPDHEVVNVILELKQIIGHTFDLDHRIQDLDRALWELVGPRLYTPAEFLARCPGAPTLRQCLADAGWPSTDELRGRVIVNVIGNWGDNQSDWIDYASVDGGVAARAAFPLRSMLEAAPDGLPAWAQAGLAAVPNQPFIETSGGSLGLLALPPLADIAERARDGRLVAARAASIFWQLEDLRFVPSAGAAPPPESWPDFAAVGGVARSGDAQDPYLADNVPQLDVVQRYGMQMVQTDYPWHFIADLPSLRPATARVPTLAARPFFEACDVTGDRARPGQPGCRFDEAQLTEPGNRLLLADGEATFARDGGAHTWETQPSGTSVTHGDKLPPLGAPNAVGCLLARGDGAELRVCRTVDGDRARTVHVRGQAVRGGAVEPFDYVLPAQHAEPGDVGDLLRLRVVPTATGTTATVWTAGLVGPDGAPLWAPLAHGDFVFAGATLGEQGLVSTGPTLFVGTRRDGVAVRAPDFARAPREGDAGYLVDQSYCVDGGCRTTAAVAHEERRPDGWIVVHETAGRVFGQDRHGYTTDRFEAASGGLGGDVAKFLVRGDGGDGWVPLFACVDGRHDVHTAWLGRDEACARGDGPAGLSRERVGYVAALAAAGSAPLVHLRRCTSLFGPAGAADHVYAVGAAEAATWVARGYAIVETVGFVRPAR